MKNIVLICIIAACPFIGSAQFQQLKTHTWNNIGEIQLIDNNIAVAVLDSVSVMRTTDGGKNWTITSFPHVSNFHSVKFPSQAYGYLVNDTFVYSSIDSGNSWQLIFDWSWNPPIQDIYTINDSLIYLLCRYISDPKDYLLFSFENKSKKYLSIQLLIILKM